MARRRARRVLSGCAARRCIDGTDCWTTYEKRKVAIAGPARAPSKTLAAGLYASGAVAFLASAVAAATTGARGLAPFATLATFALICVKA